MKQKDIALIIAVAGISTLIAFIAGNALFGGSGARSTKISVVDAVSSSFPVTDSQDFKSQYGQYFNSQSINPTRNVQIGTNNNPKPFNQ